MSSPHSERWILALTAVGSLMVALDVLVVSTALSTIRHQLGASISQLEWTVNAYGLSFAVLLTTASALGDRLGRRRLFAGGLGLFVAASAGCALAPDVGWLIAARVVQGAAAAIVAPLSLALLSAGIPAARRPRALGIYAGITGLAVLGGPVLGGAITQGLAWRWVFWLNVPIGLAVIPLVLTRLPESRGPRRPLDGRGLALVTGAALGIVWGLVRGNQIGWGSGETLAALGSGVALLAAFVAVELRSATPMLPMQLFARRNFAGGSAAAFLLASGLFGALFFMAQFQQLALGQSPLSAGLRLLPWTAVPLFIAPTTGSVMGRLGERRMLAAGLSLQGAGLITIGLIARPGLPYVGLIAPMLLAGVGVSLAMPAAQNAIVGSAGPDELGVAAATFTMMRQLGGSLGVAAAVIAFTTAGSYASPAAFSAGMDVALAAAGGLSLLGALCGLAVAPRTRAARRAGQEVAMAEA